MTNQVETIIEPREKNIGIPVRRILPWAKKKMVGPFIFLDHMGPALMHAPEDHMDVRPHPHIGLSTLTYLFEGELLHRDSLGVKQLIVPGQVNWMTAGKGISHSEREPLEVRSKDRTIHGLQFWVALPREQEDVEPSFHHYTKEAIPEFEHGALNVKLVAGSAFGRTSKLKSYSPMIFMVMEARSEGRLQFEEAPDHEHAFYVVRGSLKVNGEMFGKNTMVVFKIGEVIEIEHSSDALIALVGGEPFPEPRYIWWNLVSSSKEKISRAREAWIKGTFPQVPEDLEKILAPDDYPWVADYP